MEGDAIQTDVSEEKTEEELKQDAEKIRQETADRRLSQIEDIVANQDRMRVEKEGMKLDLEEEEKPKGTPKETVEEPEPDLTKDEDYNVKLIVDGTEQEVPLSKVKDAGIRTLQKEATADKRLEEATAMKREAERLLSEAQTRANQLPDKTDKDAGGKIPSMTSEEIKAKKQAILQGLQYGEGDEAEKALDELLTLGRTGVAIPDAQALVEQALQKREDRKMADEAAKIRQNWDKEFGDLVKDPYLMSEASKIVNQKLASGEENTWKTYEAAGKEVRQRREETLNPKPKPKVVTMEEKKERKKAIDTIPVATARSQTTTAAEEAPVDEQDARSQAVRDIMKARGQLR